MYWETRPDGKRGYTIAQIATECGVTRFTIYRDLATIQRSQEDSTNIGR